MDERKIRAIVLEVAPHAVPAVWIPNPDERVIALLCSQAFRNFLMAFQTLERRRAGSELVARAALCGAVEGLMRFRQRAGRNLGASFGSAEQDAAEDQ